MNRFPLFSILFAIILLLPFKSSAEIREGSYEINPYFGYCNAATTRDLCHKDVYGIRAGYNFTKNVGIEGAFDYFVSRAEMYHADVIYHLMPDKPFTPFLVAGVGGAHIRPLSGDSYDTFMADAGVGIKYALTDSLGLRADVRGVFTHYDNMVASVGITIALGGKTPKSALPPSGAAAEKAAPAPVTPPAAEARPAPRPEQPPKEEAVTPPPAAAAPEEKVSPAEAKPAPEAVVLEDIHFDFNKATLNPRARKALKKDLDILKEHPSVRLQVEGNACAHGKPGPNMILSERRADTVKEYLVKGGISPDRITTIAYGKTRLAVPEIPTPKNKNSRQAKANRRVHLKVISE